MIVTVSAMLATIVVTSIAFRFILLRAERRAWRYYLALTFIAERHTGTFAHLFAAKVMEGRAEDIEKAFPGFLDWCGTRINDEQMEQLP